MLYRQIHKGCWYYLETETIQGLELSLASINVYTQDATLVKQTMYHHYLGDALEEAKEIIAEHWQGRFNARTQTEATQTTEALLA